MFIIYSPVEPNFSRIILSDSKDIYPVTLFTALLLYKICLYHYILSSYFIILAAKTAT